ncbi:MAG: homocysteine S-methyltransferase family protein [Armatimonadetes bacterium]|nr:homocysteine S-methyltransferase family protein [Armatimonadota bacterium]
MQTLKPLLADGATGTMLQAMGLPVGEPPERWTLDNPDAIRELARRYAEAGSDIVYTNTFGANRIRLQRFGLADKVFELNKLAVQLAREGVNSATRPQSFVPRPFIVASIGPTGELLEPYGDLEPEAAQDAFSEQATALAEAGVDAFVCETFSDLTESLICLKAVQSVSKIPVMVSMSFEENGRTMMGVTPEDAVNRLLDEGALVVGANCSIGPEVVEQVVNAMKAARPDALLLAKPNAGRPQLVEGKVVYPVTPEQMASFALRMKSLGVAIVGGCCGTTPEHIAAIRAALAF